MDNFIIIQNGKPLSKDKYTIDLKNKIFASKEDNLLLDFTGLDGWIFKTGHHCTFKTLYNCTFVTGDACLFKTDSDCTFDTGDICTFDTDSWCTFKTGVGCTFDTFGRCTFNTGVRCIFKTGESCTFLIFKIDSCKFKSYDGRSPILDDKDEQVYKLTKEFIQLQKIKNG